GMSGVAMAGVTPSRSFDFKVAIRLAFSMSRSFFQMGAFGFGQHSLEDSESFLDEGAVDVERRRHADGIGAARDQQQAHLEGALDNVIAQFHGALPGLAILDELDAEHQATAADLADARMATFHLRQTIHDKAARVRRLGHHALAL